MGEANVKMIYLRVEVSISYISAERFWEHDKPVPAGIHISTNINVISVEAKESKLLVPFVVTIGYTPSIAQMSLKGHAILSGERDELEKIQDDYKKQRAPPPQLLRSITTVSITEATVLSRSLNIPPPIPLPGPSQPKPDWERPSYVG